MDRELMYRQHEKRGLINNIYVFISYLKKYLEISNFYDIRDILPVFKKEYCNYTELSKKENFKDALKSAITEYNRKSGFKVTIEMKKFLINPDFIIIDEHNLSLKAALLFKEYWDDVLLGYQRKSSYINRLNYLIDYISDMLSNPLVKEYEDVKDLMISYRKEYQNKKVEAESIADHPKGLGSAKNASIKKPSSPNADNEISATAP